MHRIPTLLVLSALSLTALAVDRNQTAQAQTFTVSTTLPAELMGGCQWPA